VNIEKRNVETFFLRAYEISESGSVMLSTLTILRLMLILCLTFQGTELPVREKFNSNVAAKCK